MSRPPDPLGWSGARESPPGPSDPAPREAAIRRATSRRPRLLLVDDEPSVGRMLSHAAEQCGYQAAIAINAASFCSQYQAAEPEVVLLDLSLASGDGVELLRFLAAKESRALILIVSGFDRRVVEAADRLGRALGLRMGGCLTKPILVKELGDAIKAGRAQSALGGSANEGEICVGA